MNRPARDSTSAAVNGPPPVIDSEAAVQEPAADESQLPPGDGRPIAFFDGVCGLCNRFVDFALPRDRGRKLLFAPLQGETARRMLAGDDVDSLKTIVLVDGQVRHRRSSAVVRVLWKLGGLWSFVGTLLWLVPWPLRDLGYQVLARNRYRWFGRKDACRMPTADERSRFLP